MQVDSADPSTTDRTAAAWAALQQVMDPEVPVLSVCDLGIVREVVVDGEGEGEGVSVALTPTYSGCPATEVIEEAVRTALSAAGFVPVRVQTRRAPAWTTDWISDEGRRKLREYGIAPPSGTAAMHEGPLVIHLHPRVLDCPRCGSRRTERLSAFGSTACKALYRCLACREPFEYFKPI